MRDRDEEIYERFRAASGDRVRRLVTDELIAEHAAGPNAHHSDDLARVLHHLRGARLPGKYVIVAVQEWSDYRIARLSGRRGVLPVLVDDSPSFATEREAVHAVFLRRIDELLATETDA